MSLVIDASAVVAALVDTGPDGRWAEHHVSRGGLVAPHLMPVEVANILRRAEAAADISTDVAALAHADLRDLRLDVVPWAPVAERIWELRHNVTAYDAWYVAVAEAFDLELVTLDRRLAAAPGPRCGFLVPTDRGGP